MIYSKSAGMISVSDGNESAHNEEYPCWIPGSERSSEVGVASHSSMLPWRITWIEEPNGPQSVGSQRI